MNKIKFEIKAQIFFDETNISFNLKDFKEFMRIHYQYFPNSKEELLEMIEKYLFEEFEFKMNYDIEEYSININKEYFTKENFPELFSLILEE